MKLGEMWNEGVNKLMDKRHSKKEETTRENIYY